MNVTDPVGVVLYCGATVAVKVTDWLLADGFREEVSVVVIGRAREERTAAVVDKTGVMHGRLLRHSE
jgi:hypothetical protein